MHLHKISVMLEAFHIMLAGEYWLSKAMQTLFRPDIFKWIDRVWALDFDQHWHLSLVLCPLHCPLDLKT